MTSFLLRRAWLYLLLLLCAGCSVIEENRQLSWLDRADPQRDCAAAIARGDTRFWAVDGFASGMVLGTDQHGADAALLAAHGTRHLAGTSDTSTSRLNHKADDYARTYNQLLLRHLRGARRDGTHRARN